MWVLAVVRKCLVKETPGLERVSQDLELVVNGNQPKLEITCEVPYVFLENLVKLFLGFDLHAEPQVCLDKREAVLVAFDQSRKKSEYSSNDLLVYNGILLRIPS